MNDERSQFPQELPMARIASLLVLLVIIGALGFVFIRVMASFWLPLFLAALLVVIFRPLHQWILDACEGKQKRSAVLTTLAILLAVLGPLVWVGTVAFEEATNLRYRDWGELLSASGNEDGDASPLDRLRAKFKLDMPYAEQLEELKSSFEEMEKLHSANEAGDRIVVPTECETLVKKSREALVALRVEVRARLIERLESIEEEVTSHDELAELVYSELLGEAITKKQIEDFKADPDPQKELKLINELTERSQFDSLAEEIEKAHRPILDELQTRRERGALGDELTAEFKLKPGDGSLDVAVLEYRKLRSGRLGGPILSWLRALANPSPTQLQDWQGKALGYFRRNVVSLTGQGTAIVGSFAFGLFVLTISIYYFLIDGPKLIRAAMRLSPLDNKYEQELFAEFGNVSRAVVLATLLSAVVQGVLAGLGYWAVGAKPLFLLTLVTGLLAMVPFVGAAAVWLPVSLWVMFAQPTEVAGEVGRLIPGIALAVYGTVIVSMADNLIKPWVLAGQSNLHPLLGLLSVLGGVKTLGPIGLLVGPMVVSFLQALLNMLNAELGEKITSATDSEPAIEVVRRKAAPSSS